MRYTLSLFLVLVGLSVSANGQEFFEYDYGITIRSTHFPHDEQSEEFAKKYGISTGPNGQIHIVKRQEAINDDVRVILVVNQEKSRHEFRAYVFKREKISHDDLMQLVSDVQDVWTIMGTKDLPEFNRVVDMWMSARYLVLKGDDYFIDVESLERLKEWMNEQRQKQEQQEQN